MFKFGYTEDTFNDEAKARNLKYDAIERNRVRIIRDEWETQKELLDDNWAGLWSAAHDLIDRVDDRDYDDYELSDDAKALHGELIDFLAMTPEEYRMNRRIERELAEEAGK